MSDDPPFLQRAIGSAMVTGAAVASVGLSMGRPMVREGVRRALDPESPVRTASVRAARELGHAAAESGRPAFYATMEAKDRVRRRAIGMLPRDVGSVVEGWRIDFIEAEKSVYYGGKAAYKDVEPHVDMACEVGLDLLERFFDIVDEVVDAGVAATATVGEGLQQPAPPRRARPSGAGRKSGAKKRR